MHYHGAKIAHIVLRLLLLSALLTGCAFCQPATTGTMANGRFWVSMPFQVKIMYVTAVFDTARYLDARTSGKRTPDADSEFNTIFIGSMTTGETAKELDQFFSEPANAPVPVIMAIRWVSAKARGADHEELERIENFSRRVASEAAKANIDK